MKASELRIGNLILDKTNKVIEVNSINEAYGDSNGKCNLFTFSGGHGDAGDFWWEQELKECNGIPLTEEWLVKFGFTLSHTQAMKKYDEFGNQVSLNRIGKNYELTYLSTPVNYVHQLQNLYFALTGEELVLNG